MSIKSINPVNNKVMKTFEKFTDEEIALRVETAH